jgi:hypothetical protein
MTTLAMNAEPDRVERAISENVNTLLLRAHMKRRQLAATLDLPSASLNRHINGTGTWGFREVRAIADYFAVTVDEIATDLPSFDEWQVRWNELRACRDSNPKPSVLESGALRARLTAVTSTAELHRRLRLVPVNHKVTENRVPAGWPIPEPRTPLPTPESGYRGRHLKAVS